MGAWWSSLESLLRTQNILLWVGTVSALLVAFSGIFGYFVNARIGVLRQSATQQTAVHQSEVERRAQSQQAELAEARQLLDASETRSEGFLDRIETLQEHVESLTEERDNWKEQAESRRPPPAAADGFLTAQQRSKFVRALTGSPPSSLTIITIAGNAESEQMGSRLAGLLREAGWTAFTRQDDFPQPPASHTFVVHSRESTPESALSLSVALAIVELASFPPKVMLDANNPPGFLGLIVVPGSE